MRGSAMSGAFDQAADQHRAAVADRDARFARVRAALRERGFDLSVITVHSSPLFVIGRWGHTRDFADLGAVEAFARQVGVKP